MSERLRFLIDPNPENEITWELSLKPVETMDKSKRYLAVEDGIGWVIVHWLRFPDEFSAWVDENGRPLFDIKGWALELPELLNSRQKKGALRCGGILTNLGY